MHVPCMPCKSLTTAACMPAWLAAGSSHVVIAVVDTGVDLSHPDIAANLWVNPGEIPGNGIDDDNNGALLGVICAGIGN